MAWKYRILERRIDGDLTPFGVAYEREGGGIYLFAPFWRADRKLDASSVDDLTAEHFPTPAGYQWGIVQTTDQPVPAPIELLERALSTAPATASQPHPVEPEPEVEPSRPSLFDTIASLLFGKRPGFAMGAGDEDQPGQPQEPEVRSADLSEKLEELQNDPQLRRALVHLLTALSDPAVRPKVISALESWARVARKDDEA
jgi:hypothetical protein